MSHLARVRQFLLRPATRHYFTTPPPWGPPNPMTLDNTPWKPNFTMKRGPKHLMDYLESDTGLNLWVLMPGVPKENVTVNVIVDKISFRGTELLNLPVFPASEDDARREYDGFFLADPTRFDAEKVKAEIVDGILWLHLPKFTH